MKIGIFIKNYAVGKQFDKSGVPNKSGAEFHAENHAKLFLEAGHSCYVMTKKTYFFTKARELVNGIEVVRLHDPIRWLEVMVRILTTHANTDCFYILGMPKFAVWAVLMARFLGKKTTLTLTSSSEMFKKNDSWRNRILASCDNYIAISSQIARGLVEDAAVPESKIHVLPQGIDAVKRFVPVTAIKKLELRKQYDVPQEAFVVLFCARVVINKGIDTMIMAWRQVHAINPNAYLVVVGGGVNELMDDLRNASKELDDTIKVVGEVPKTDAYYQLSDIYLFPSRFEGCPTTLMEAMSCCLPAVASKIGGVEDLLEDGKTGILVDAENPKDFAEGILKLAEDKQLVECMGQAAREHAVKNLDCHALLPRLLDILQDNIEK